MLTADEFDSTLAQRGPKQMEVPTIEKGEGEEEEESGEEGIKLSPGGKAEAHGGGQ